ncbi:disks large-associated protein 5-like isoform X1 [Festucalex cinctus]
MESQFSYLRRRDSSVAMLRVKMSRRQSQNQKENRERMVDARRQLDNLQEDDKSYLDSSVATNTSAMKDRTNLKEKSAKEKDREERLKQLARWKEKKALEKEKQKQERERKGVFKTGLYRPKDTVFSMPLVPVTSTKAKVTKTNTAPPQSSIVTRSMAQQKTHKSNRAAKKVEPVVRGPSTRSANRPVSTVPAAKNQPKDTRETLPDQRITKRLAVVAPSPRPASQKNCTAKDEHDVHPPVPQDNVEPGSEEENDVMDQGPVEPSSFAPEGSVFNAPAGVEAFNFAALTPRSADRFLAPGSACLTPAHINVRAAAVLVDERQAEPMQSSAPKSPPPPPRADSPTPNSPLETKHDVAYFRSEMANETDRLTSLCAQWETRFDDESIPEEMIGLICTTVGQARLLMKERFKQFSGLVDDCHLRRGEKITTFSDLQGFWDMVYFQVKDVHRKFDSLKEAEARGWVEEHKPPPPRQRKAIKKPAAAPAKPPVTKAGKSELAALKAAMRAQKKAAEAAKAAAARAAGEATDKPRPSCEGAQGRSDIVVFDGGFFRVESPIKTPGSVRRSSRLSAAAAPPQASPLTNHSTTPRRVTRSSLALGPTARTPVQSTLTPLRTTNRTPQRSQRAKVDTSTCLSPSGGTQLEEVPREGLFAVATALSPLVPQTQQVETAEDSLFIFAMNPKDRIRPSVCPNDLMSFTPPPQ